MFQKQIIMRRVLYSLIPIVLFSLYLYGIRPLVILLVSIILGTATEYIMEKGRNKKVSEAVLVTSTLFALSLPPKTPLWVVAVGIVFAVFMGKEVYGGFGRNIFNPAITGRLFIYITFPNILAASWMAPGKFGSYADVVSAATPLGIIRAGNTSTLNLLDLFLGFKGGSIGEGSILLILLAGIYLVFTKTASYRIILGTVLGSLGLSFGLDAFGVQGAFPALYSLFSGSVLFVAVFMATDPVSAPKRASSQWIYGILIGIVSIILRLYSAFPEGTSFALLLSNTFASLIDELTTPKAKEVVA
ncbi:MAG TPA: RnfABCDGE type electron transport complex subunit D [Spirochaetales bacterium]|nr:RnfABCDGE type electron transport complex subunit D [Spirochaetales bacterium]